MRVYLARHATTDLYGCYCGHSNPPLNREGLHQAKMLAARLASVGIERIFTSDLKRAVETAHAISSSASVPVVSTPLLREVDFGLWEGLSFEQISRNWGERFRRWLTTPSIRAPQGESLSDLMARVEKFLSSMIVCGDYETVCIVGHGGSIRALLSKLAQIPWEAAFSIDISPASLTLVELINSKGVIRFLNDTCHLKGKEWGD